MPWQNALGDRHRQFATLVRMDIDRIISEIEQLERIFSAPCTRALSASDLAAANRRHVRSKPAARGFNRGSVMESVAVMNLLYCVLARSKVKAAASNQSLISLHTRPFSAILIP